jgi:hypothetical protein
LAIKPLVEELFEVFSPYFPIDFTPIDFTPVCCLFFVESFDGLNLNGPF